MTTVTRPFSAGRIAMYLSFLSRLRACCSSLVRHDEIDAFHHHLNEGGRFIDCDEWGFPYIFPLTWMVSGAPILLIGLQILTTLSLQVSIRAIGRKTR